MNWASGKETGEDMRWWTNETGKEIATTMTHFRAGRIFLGHIFGQPPGTKPLKRPDPQNPAFPRQRGVPPVAKEKKKLKKWVPTRRQRKKKQKTKTKNWFPAPVAKEKTTQKCLKDSPEHPQFLRARSGAPPPPWTLSCWTKGKKDYGATPELGLPQSWDGLNN